MRRLQRVALLAVCLLAAPAAATTITIVNNDGAGEGFNDLTVVAPVGGNAGVTRGAQRLIVFQQAAAMWAGVLNSTIEIKVGATFDALFCDMSGGVLGLAG